MTKFNRILIIALVVQLALTAFVFWPQSGTQGSGGPLLPDLAAADIVGLTIHDSDNNRLALAKSGEEWVLPESGDFPIDGEKISPLLEKIEGLQTNRLVTQTEASHKRLKVAEDDFNRLLEISLQDGRNYKLYLGSSAGAGATHIRLDDQSEVYLAGELNTYEANARSSAWIDTLYHTVPKEDVVALTLENENGTFEFEKDGENWVMKGLADDETFKESGLTTLLNQATSVRMTGPIGQEEEPSFGLDEPLAVVTLKTIEEIEEEEQEKTYTLRVGAKSDDDNSYVVNSSESPYYVRVSEDTGNNFIEKTHADFLEEEPVEEADEVDADVSESE